MIRVRFPVTIGTRMRSVILCLTLLFLGSSVTPAVAASKKDATVSDDVIYDQVKRKLADDADVKGGALDVEVHNGVVTLKGRVAGDKEKAKAEKLAKKVKGVTKVQNELIPSPEANPQN